jgi:hypothetical protein
MVILIRKINKTHLDERLHFASVGQLLLTHSPCDFSGVALDSGNDSMGERSVLGTLIQLLNDNNLFAGLTTLEDDGNLNSFVKSKYRSVNDAAYLARLVY